MQGAGLFAVLVPGGAVCEGLVAQLFSSCRGKRVYKEVKTIFIVYYFMSFY